MAELRLAVKHMIVENNLLYMRVRWIAASGTNTKRSTTSFEDWLPAAFVSYLMCADMIKHGCFRLPVTQKHTSKCQWLYFPSDPQGCFCFSSQKPKLKVPRKVDTADGQTPVPVKKTNPIQIGINHLPTDAGCCPVRAHLGTGFWGQGST